MENTQAVAETNWKPKPWIAVVLGLFSMPFSMLYLGKPRFALCYFLAAICLTLADIWLAQSGIAPWSKYVSIIWPLIILCTVHSYRLAKRETLPLPRVWYSRWYGMVTIVISSFLVILGARCFFYEPFKVPSVSMMPTLSPGTLVVTQKLGFGNYETFGIHVAKMPLSEKIERGDIVVFKYPLDPKLDYVKRVIGLPGDAISYKSKILLVNGIKMQATPQEDSGGGQVIAERYGDKSWQTIVNPGQPPHDFEGKVPEHRYFVLGDNRDNSADSRHWGFVPEENLIGKVIYVSK